MITEKEIQESLEYEYRHAHSYVLNITRLEEFKRNIRKDLKEIKDKRDIKPEPTTKVRQLRI